MTEESLASVPVSDHHTHHQLPATCSRSLAEKVVTAVADAANTSPNELPPLYEVIEPDALNRLFAPTYTGNSRSEGRITFLYAGYRVVINSSSIEEVSSTDA